MLACSSGRAAVNYRAVCFQQEKPLEKKEEKAQAKPAEEKKEEEPKPGEGVWLVSSDWLAEDWSTP